MQIARAIELLAAASEKGDLAPLADLIVAERFPYCCFGVTAEFFFDTYGDADHQQVLVALAEEYYADAATKPSLIVGDSRHKKLKSVDQIADFAARELKGRVTPERRIFSFYIDADIGETHLSRYTYSCIGDSSIYPFCGSLYCAWPVLNEAADIAKHVERFAATARRLRATYAVSGLALLFETYASYPAEVCFPFYERLPGLVYADSNRFGMARGRNRRAIRDVNWLTAIDADSVAALGGLGHLRSSLGDEVGVLPYDGGVAFRAGLTPVLGDNKRGDVPGLYRQVGRALRPLRVTDYGPSGYLRAGEPFNAAEESQKWLSRFD